MLTVKVTFVLAVFVHIRNISALILFGSKNFWTKCFLILMLLGLILFDLKFAGQKKNLIQNFNFLDPNFFLTNIFSTKIILDLKFFLTQICFHSWSFWTLDFLGPKSFCPKFFGQKMQQKKCKQAQLRLCKLGPGTVLIFCKSLAPTPIYKN